MIDRDIGGRLRRAREQRGLSLQDVSRATRLSLDVLRKIERNDFASLPDGIYRKAYLRTVAGVVGFSADDIAADYEAICGPTVSPPAALSASRGISDRRIDELTPSPGKGLVTLAVLVMLSVGWFMLRSDEVRLGASPENDGSAPLAVLDAASVYDVASMAARRDASADVTIAPVALRIEIATTGWCWVSAESDDTRVLYGLIEPGKRVVVEAQRRIALRLGDGGAVSLSINDAPPRTAGKPGEVVALELTPDAVKDLRDS